MTNEWIDWNDSRLSAPLRANYVYAQSQCFNPLINYNHNHNHNNNYLQHNRNNHQQQQQQQTPTQHPHSDLNLTALSTNYNHLRKECSSTKCHIKLQKIPKIQQLYSTATAKLKGKQWEVNKNRIKLTEIG